MFAKKMPIKTGNLLRKTQEAHIVFLVLSLAITIFFALKIPLGYGPDESVQAFRTYHVSRGHISTHLIGTDTSSSERVNLYGGKVPSSLIALEQYTSGGIRHEVLCSSLKCGKLTSAQKQTVTQLSRAPIEAVDSGNVHFWGAGYYFFIAYLPGAVGMDIAQASHTSVGHMVVASRLTSAVFYCAMVAWAVYLLRRSRAKWLVFSVGVLPVALSQAACLGADAFINAASLLLFSLIVRAFEDGKLRPTLKALAIALAIVLPLCKSPYLLLSLVILFTPAVQPVNRSRWQIPCIAAAIIIPTIAWSFITADMAHTQAVLTHADGGTPNFKLQEHYILTHPITYASTLTTSVFKEDWLGGIALITQQFVLLPLPLTLLSLLIVGSTAVYATTPLKTQRQLSTSAALSLFVGAILCLAAIGTAMYVSYNPVGSLSLQGVQGRYLIPVIPYLTLGAASIIPVKLTTTQPRHARQLFICSAIVMLACTVWWYYIVVY